MSEGNTDSWKKIIEEEGYTVLQCIDYGSFSDVFTVTQNNSQTILALKKIESRHPIEEDECVLSEVKCLLRLRHRHVIQLKDVLLTSNIACIIMEYASLGNLFDYVQEKGKLSNSSIYNLFSQMLSGLSFCHSNQIAHRDLNPSNMLLTSPTLVKLGDFGLGFVCNDDDGSPRLCNEYLGQAAYLSPEVLMHIPFRPEPADVWSLGCVLYFMCFGDKPFSGSAETILSTQLEEGLTLPHTDVTTPSFFASTLQCDMCCVDVNTRNTVDCVYQHWINSDIEEMGVTQNN